MFVKTLNITDSVSNIETSAAYKYYWIRNLGAEDVSVFKASADVDTNKKIILSQDEYVKIIPENNNIYFKSSSTGTKIEVYGTNTDICPFKAGKVEGSKDGGGDNTHYKGTTTTALENGSTTNPIIIDGESYTAVFGDVVVYGYTEFVFDGTTWSEFGRPFDTVPTSGSMNAVTSDGIYKCTPLVRGKIAGSAAGGYNSTATRSNSFAYGASCTASGLQAVAFGNGTQSDQTSMLACGTYNSPRAGDLFNIGIGTGPAFRKNIVEVNHTSANVNGDIKINNIAIPTPYTTMPTITENMLGQIAMYVGATGNGYTQGCFYIASTDGAAEPTYSWVRIGSTRTETVLWQYDPNTMQPGQNITLSDKFSNYDEIYFDSYYNQLSVIQPTTRAGGSIYLSALFADASDTNRQYLSVNGVVQGSPEFCDFYYDGNLTLYAGAVQALWVGKIIGIKY